MGSGADTDGNDDVVFDAATVAFGEKLAASDAFQALFREGMALIEETASYLDGPGRVESKELSRTAALAYATESMRLTTRLMQLASWLLLQRAVNEGELSREQARADKHKVRLNGLGASEATPAAEELPPDLIALVDRSLRLRERVMHLDKLLEEPPEVPAEDHGVRRDHQRLMEAFARKG